MVMKTMTKLFALGAGLLGVGAGAVAAVRAKRRAAAPQQQIDAFDYADLDEPVIVTEEVVVITEASPYEIDMELIPAEEPAQQQSKADESSFEMPGRNAGPR